MSQYLTIDVGGTNIKYALMNDNADILEQGEVPTPRTCLEDFEDAIAGIYDKYKEQGIAAVCMSAPGRINAETGYFHTSGALKYVSGICLPEHMKDRIPVPFTVENDAKAAALAELWRGAMKGFDSGSVITLGTGIGGSLILGGKLVRGNTYAAGEFSGISTRWDLPYGEGNSWASVSSTKALTDLYASKKGVAPEEMNGRIFFKDVEDKDPVALEVLDTFCESVATGIMSLQLILDLQRYCFGGGISNQPILLETINKKLDGIFEREVHTPASRPDVVKCAFGSDANLIGALYHYLYELKK